MENMHTDVGCKGLKQFYRAEFIITYLVNLSNQIQLRERASYSYCAWT